MRWLTRLFGWGSVRREAVGQPSAPPVDQSAVIPVVAFGEAPSGAPPSTLTERDMARLRGVHPDLVRVVVRASQKQAFFVAEGLRTLERQKELFAAGKSKTLASRHLTGHAVDLYPVSKVPIPQMTLKDFEALAFAMKQAASEEGVQIVWGGDWKSFVDAPHWELPRSLYGLPWKGEPPDAS